MITTMATADGRAPVDCQEQGTAEGMTEYASRVLRYALNIGPETLTISQLEIADSQASRHVAALPAELDHGGTVLDTCLHGLRHRMQRLMLAKRRQLAQLQRMIDGAGDGMSGPDDDASGQPDAASAPVQTEQERALALLRAALMLIMGPQPPSGNGGGGGRPAMLVRPKPGKPPSGQAVNPRQGDSVDF